MSYYIALDVGGSSIKSAVIDNGRIVSEVHRTPSRSSGSADEILNALCEAVNKCACPDAAGIGVGFPGPFDYPEGISRMRGLGKFDSIYGIPLASALQERIPGIPAIRFTNDAEMYALGEAVYGVGKGFGRVFAACIGTGIGSGFCIDGKLVKEGEGVPENGWIYNTPCLDSIADAYASASGIRRMMRAVPELESIPDVKELSDAARSGNEYALKLFERFADILRGVILPHAIRFKADCVVIGGDVAKSADLFTLPLRSSLEEKGIRLRVSERFSDMALCAAPLLFI